MKRKNAKEQAIHDMKMYLKSQDKSFFSFDVVKIDEKEMRKIVKDALKTQKSLSK